MSVQAGRNEISSIPPALRVGVFVCALGGALAWGAVFGSSPSEAFHLAVVPVFACYALLFRPGLLRQIAPRHIIYFAVLALAVAVYLLVFAHVTVQAAVSWTEIPLALYFLLAVHLVVWAIDRAVAAALRLAPVLGRSRGRAAAAGRTLARVVLLVALSAPYLTATFLVHWVKFRDVSDPYDLAGMKFEPVRFDATDAVSIGGWWIPAAEPGSDSSVILIGGRAQSKLTFLLHAQMLREDGYHVLMPDLRGSGGSAGHTRSYGCLESRDVLGAVRFLKATRPAASRHIFVMGIGDGSPAALAAARAGPEIQAVVLDSPCGGIEAALDKILAPLPRRLRNPLRQTTLAIASAELGTDISGGDLRSAMAGLRERPVLIIQGEEDSIAPPAEAEKLFQAGQSPVVLWRIPLARHTEAILLAPFQYGRNVRTLFESARRNSPELLRLIDPEEW